jgi:hypothetical protein
MVGQQIERLDFADRSRMTYLRMDQESESGSAAGLYFEFLGRSRRMAATIVRSVTRLIRPPDQFFGSSPRAASFTRADLKFAWVGVMAGIVGLAALLLLGWSEIGADPVSATERPADPSPRLAAAAAAQFETQADRMEGIRQRGLDLLRGDFHDEEPPPPTPLARGDRLPIQDTIMKPAIRVATAGEDERSVAPSAPLPRRPVASKPSQANEKHAAEERPAHRRHARHASRHHRDRIRMAHAKYVQVPGEPQVASGNEQQPNRAPEENKTFGWVTRLPDAIVPSSWKDGWDNLWSK